MVSNVTTGMQNESELSLCELDDDFFLELITTLTLALQSLLLMVNLTSLKNLHQMGTRQQLFVLTLAHI